jgi:hypothetical protein
MPRAESIARLEEIVIFLVICMKGRSGYAEMTGSVLLCCGVVKLHKIHVLKEISVVVIVCLGILVRAMQRWCGTGAGHTTPK